MNNIVLPPSAAEARGRFGKLLNFLAGEVQKQLPDGLTCALVVFSTDTGKYAGYSTPAPGESSRRRAISALEQCVARLKAKKFIVDTTETEKP